MAERLTILVCAFACDPGGVSPLGSGESILGWRIVEQAARFHEVHVLTHAGNRPSIEAAMDQGAVPNAHFHYVSLPRAAEWCVRHHRGPIQLYAYLWQMRACVEATRLHRRHRFDLFHHATFGNDWMASHTGALLPVPYVRGPGGEAHRMPAELKEDYPLAGRLWEWVRSRGQWMYRHDPFFIIGHNRAKAILVCNREAYDNLPCAWRRKAELFPVNGVSDDDLQIIERASKADRDTSPFCVLSAGSLLPLKRFDLAIEAFGRFARAHTDAVMKIAGDGPELSRLQAVASATGIGDRVQFCGHLSRHDLLAEMVACDVFLFASTRDGGGAVVVEAMAARKPVVCFDIAGPGTHIRDGCGIKVAPAGRDRAIRELAKALRRLYRSPSMREEMGRRARHHAEASYHWDRLGERLSRIYRNTVAGTEASVQHASTRSVILH